MSPSTGSSTTSKRIVVYRLRGDRYDAREELVAPAVLRTPVLPGLEIPLADLFS